MKQFILLGFVLLLGINPVKAQKSISGYVISLETAKPIANATVFLNNQYNLPLKEPLRVTSDSTGFFRIAGVKPSTYIINAWTTYRDMNQQYAMVMESNRIDIDRSLTVDFVFSENAFKLRLYSKKHPWKGFMHQKRNSDMVARRAVRPQIYIDSQRDTVDAFYIKKINDNRQ